MAQIKFYRGLKEKYNQEELVDCIYFSTDSQEIIVNGISYGGNQGIEDVTYDNGTLTISKKDQEPISYDLSELLNFNTQLPDDLTTPTKIGGLASGTSVATLKTKTLSQLFEDILFEEIQPTIQNPSCSITPKGSWANGGIYEVGSAAPSSEEDFNVSFNRGTCTVVGQPTKYRAGEETGRDIKLGTSALASDSKITLGTMTYNLTVNYGEGDTLLTSKGNKATNANPNPLTAGSVKSSCSIYGTYPYFSNGTNASTSSKESTFPTSFVSDQKLKLYKWTDTLIGAKFASEAQHSTRLEFLYPALKTVSKVEFYNTVSNAWEVFSSNNYTLQEAEQKNINGEQIDYMKLTTTGSYQGEIQLRFTVANDISKMMKTRAAVNTLAANDVSLLSTSGREEGVASFAVNFEPKKQAPLDARSLVPTKADLINPDTYASNNAYSGMLVVVQDEGAIYLLTDIAKVSQSDYSGWKRLDAGSVTDALVYKGTIGSGGTLETLPTTYQVGWTYKIVTTGTYAGNVCEVGDMLIAIVSRSGSGNLDSDWTVVQSNVDGAVIGPETSLDNHIATFSGTTGKVIKDSGVDVTSLISDVPDANKYVRTKGQWSKLTGIYDLGELGSYNNLAEAASQKEVCTNQDNQILTFKITSSYGEENGFVINIISGDKIYQSLYWKQATYPEMVRTLTVTDGEVDNPAWQVNTDNIVNYVTGPSLFALTTESTDEQIRNALQYPGLNKQPITKEDLDFCIKTGRYLVDAVMRNPVWVGWDGSSYTFTMVGMSSPKSSPSLGVVSIEPQDDGTFKVPEKGNGKKSVIITGSNTVNGYALSKNPVLGGKDILLTEFTPLEDTVTSEEELTPTAEDSVNQAVAKLFRAILNNEQVDSEAINKIKSSLGLDQNLSYTPTSSALSGKTMTEAIDYVSDSLEWYEA